MIASSAVMELWIRQRCMFLDWKENILAYRLMTLLLIIVLLLASNVSAAQAATTTVACSLDGTFTITDNVVTGNTLCQGTATIPAGVTAIGNAAFLSASGLTTVTFEADSQLTSIGDYAFTNASSLATVTFAAGSQLTSIGAGEYSGATALTAIIIPAGVTSIGERAFAYASALRSVYFLADKPTLETDAFGGVSGATAYIRSTATGFPAVGTRWGYLTIANGVYTLTYNTNGGSAIAAGVVLHGLPIATPPASTRSSYTFVGWSASNGGDTLTFPYLPDTASTTTLYAKWILITPTRTATRTATRPAARTATRTTARTATRTTARPRTLTATRTRTRTFTRTRTRTLTRTPIRTPIRTPTRTPTRIP